MSWRDSAADAVAAVAALHPVALARRLTVDRLAGLARALRVRSTGRKAIVAAGIVARADLLDRMSTLGIDPHKVARTFKRESLRSMPRGSAVSPGAASTGSPPRSSAT